MLSYLFIAIKITLDVFSLLYNYMIVVDVVIFLPYVLMLFDTSLWLLCFKVLSCICLMMASVWHKTDFRQYFEDFIHLTIWLLMLEHNNLYI